MSSVATTKKQTHCQRCLQKFKYGPAMAGRVVFCPRCKSPLRIPGEMKIPEELEVIPMVEVKEDPKPVQCDQCLEIVNTGARRCKNCGCKVRYRSEVRRTEALGFILAFIMPIFGLFAGVYLHCTGSKKGTWVILTSFIAFICYMMMQII